MSPSLPAPQPLLLLRLRDLRKESVLALTRVLEALTVPSSDQELSARESPLLSEAALHVDNLQSSIEFGDVEAYAESLVWLERNQRVSAKPEQRMQASLKALGVLLIDRLEEHDGLVVDRYLCAAWDRYTEVRSLPRIGIKEPHAWPEAAGFEDALLKGDVRAALAILDNAMSKGTTFLEFAVHVVQPAMYRVGDRWQCSSISVAQEHLASAIAQSVMAQGLLRSEPSAPLGKRILLACVKGNRHTLGLRMVADAVQLAGAEVQYLGANVPSASLMQQVAIWRPHLVGLSVSFPQHFQTARRLIDQMREEVGPAPQFMLGGLGVSLFPCLTRRTYADFVCHDAKGAVRVARGGVAAV